MDYFAGSDGLPMGAFQFHGLLFETTGVFLLAADHVIEGCRQGGDFILPLHVNLHIRFTPVNLLRRLDQGSQGSGDAPHEK